MTKVCLMASSHFLGLTSSCYTNTCIVATANVADFQGVHMHDQQHVGPYTSSNKPCIQEPGYGRLDTAICSVWPYKLLSTRFDKLGIEL